MPVYWAEDKNSDDLNEKQTAEVQPELLVQRSVVLKKLNIEKKNGIRLLGRIAIVQRCRDRGYCELQVACSRLF